MTSVPVVILLGDSNMAGTGNSPLDDVPVLTFDRWTGEAWPTTLLGSTMTEAKDASMPDVLLLSPNMPCQAADQRRVTNVVYSVAPDKCEITLSGANLDATQQDSWVYIAKNSTGYGQVLQIVNDPSGGTTITVYDPLLGTAYPLLTVANNGLVDLLTKSHTIASVTTDTIADTTTIAKTGLTPDFSVAVGDWVVIIAGGAARVSMVGEHARRVVSSTATTVTVSPAIDKVGYIPIAGDGIREMTTSNTCRSLAEITSTRCAWRALRFYHDGNPSYNTSDLNNVATGIGLPYASPRRQMGSTGASHTGAVNCTPELAWWLKNHFAGYLYVVGEALGGSTAVAQTRTDALTDDTPNLYSWQVDIDHKDLRPGSPNGLYTALTKKLDAAKALIVAAGDTMNVVGIFSNVGTNDAIWEQYAELYETTMGSLIDNLRGYCVDNSMTTLTADTIPFGLTQVNATLPVRPYKAEVNAAMDALVAAKECVFAVDSSTWTLAADDLHLTTASQILLGKAFYDGWAALYMAAAAFTVETGSASSTSNSYCTVNAADTYHDEHGDPSAWSAATTATKEAALRQATRALDVAYGSKWAGDRYSGEQALDWPREYAVDSAGEYIASTTIPTRLIEATAILALLHVQGETILPSTETSADVSQESMAVGGVSRSRTYVGGKPTHTLFPVIDKLLATAGLIAWGGIGWGGVDW